MSNRQCAHRVRACRGEVRIGLPPSTKKPPDEGGFCYLSLTVPGGQLTTTCKLLIQMVAGLDLYTEPGFGS
jgi:hypothetical protein